MAIQRAPSLNQTILLLMLVFLCLPIAILGSLRIFREIQRFRAETEELRNEYVESQKALLQSEVEQAVDYIRYNHTLTEERLKQTIKDRVYEAYDLAMHLYQHNRETRTPTEIQTIIKEALRPIRFNHGRGYYFATNLNGIEELFADHPELEGENLLSMQDTQGQYVIRDMIGIVQQSGEGFYQYTWTKPQETGKDFAKIAFVKHFEPYDWFLGTGEYLDDVQADIQREVLEYLVNIRFGAEGYLFGSTYRGGPLFTNGAITVGTGSVWDLTDPNGVKIIREQRKAVAQPAGGFAYYVWKKLTNQEPSPKVSFVKGFPEWQWIIGAGVYLDDIEAVVFQKRQALRRQITQDLTGMLLVLSLLLLVMSVSAHYFVRRIQNSFAAFARFFHVAATTAAKIEERSVHFEEFRHMAISANRMIDEQNRIRAEEQQMEQALRASEEQFRNLYQTVQAGVIVQAADGTILHVNDMACKIFGMTPAEVTAKTSHDPVGQMMTEDGVRISEEEHPSMMTIRTGQPLRNVVRGFFSDDTATLRWLLINTAPIFEAHSDKVQQVVITFLDITDLKQAEEQIQTLNAELELRVRQRTHELEVANRELKDFAYVVSHDLKAPLRGISRLACWLTEDYAQALDEKGREMASLLIGRVTRMDALIDGILEYSRIGRILGETTRIDLNDLLPEVVDMLAPPSHIHVRIAADFPIIKADRFRLTQVFQNLIGNAIKFLDKPEGHIGVDVEETGDYWTFRVTDNGPGIDKKYHAKIFQIFQTLVPRDMQENTGVGLALVKKIVEFHGGTVWVESTVGQGSTFFFTLPKSEDKGGDSEL